MKVALKLVGRKEEEGKRRGVLGLARVPNDLEEAKGLGRGEERRGEERSNQVGASTTGASLQATTERCTHTGHCNTPVTLTGG